MKTTGAGYAPAPRRVVCAANSGVFWCSHATCQPNNLYMTPQNEGSCQNIGLDGQKMKGSRCKLGPVGPVVHVSLWGSSFLPMPVGISEGNPSNWPVEEGETILIAVFNYNIVVHSSTVFFSKYVCWCYQIHLKSTTRCLFQPTSFLFLLRWSTFGRYNWTSKGWPQELGGSAAPKFQSLKSVEWRD